MIGKAQLIASMRHETKVIKHLVGKVPAGKLEYRPTPGQRSTIELLRYLTTCGIVAATNAVTGSWDHAKAAEQQAAKLRLEDIPKALDAQMAAIERLLADIPDADLDAKPAKLPWGEACTLGEALLNMPVKFLSCYRMQLFLYAKACGAEIGTANCWGGIDGRRT